ncbi:response regulator transcription factor [Glutamicibacter arilaitensis]|uniref:response regulator transcription factor n=1 Tax=Glutamicibacter arilaitensis TaxID=256701 RepID=UPI003FD19B4D
MTERERQVLGELATGKNNQEIAAVLGLSEATVKTHLSNLLAKLHLRDRVQGVLFAHRAGLIQ